VLNNDETSFTGGGTQYTVGAQHKTDLAILLVVTSFSELVSPSNKA